MGLQYYQRWQQPALAVECFRMALEIEPQHEQVQKILVKALQQVHQDQSLNSHQLYPTMDNLEVSKQTSNTSNEVLRSINETHSLQPIRVQ